jgi:riboflavin kinase / FMN adenylyltransferase
MESHQHLNHILLPSCVLAIGSFDGVHLGHQALIHDLVDGGRRAGLPSVVVTFFPHPATVLHGKRLAFYLTSPEEKAERLHSLGVDHVVTQPFDLELSRSTADEFLAWLEGRLHFRGLWMGEDFVFGHQRQGNREYLEYKSRSSGFDLHVLGPVSFSGQTVSSSRIREALQAGDVELAASLLGRGYAVDGQVIRGARRGSLIGIPTANLSIWDERVYPKRGVYAGWAELSGQRHQAVTNIGIRPTFDDGQRQVSVETHLLDFRREIYGERLRVSFQRRLRNELRFEGPQALVQQIERDIQLARSVLQETPETDDA